MPLRFDQQLVRRRFGALDADQIARVEDVVTRAHVSAMEAAYLAPGAISSWWSSVIGAESTAAALRSNAAAAQNLYEVLKAKRDRLITDPAATEYDVAEMESAISAMGNEASWGASYLLTPAAAVIETAKGTYQDVTSAVKAPFGVPMWAWLAGAGALALLLFLPRRRS